VMPSGSIGGIANGPAGPAGRGQHQLEIVVDRQAADPAGSQ
jgi:hypothetical protein